MMKQEFDNLVGLTTAPEAYERIEFVYMNSDKFQTKQEIADFYKEHDMNGIEGIYKDLVNTRSDDFRGFISDLAIFAGKYVDDIKKQFATDAHTIYQNKTAVKLLHEYAGRKRKEQEQLYKDFLYVTQQYPHADLSFSNNCLTNASHYETVLAGLLVRK